MIVIKSKREIDIMKQAGYIVAKTHTLLKEEIAAGITTKEIDRLAEEFIKKENATPAFKGYQGFPATVCVARNEAVVHGIPDSTRLESGDIIGLDIGAIYDGYYGDAARTLAVGEIKPEAKKLLKTTQAALDTGISQAIADNRLSDISNAIQTYVEAKGYSVVRNFVGHGIGSQMHEDPQIPNFGKAGRGPRLKPGMALAIEPMVNLGTYKVETLDDGWTVVTKDRKLSAHFEDTVVVTKQGPEILTKL